MPSKLGQLGGVFMKSTVVKHSIVVAGHKTSVSLEDAFWNGLKEIVRERHMTLSELVAEIDAQRQLGNPYRPLPLDKNQFHSAVFRSRRSPPIALFASRRKSRSPL